MTNKATQNPLVKQQLFIKQKGVSLIEVMIAVFILASGLLGMAALQTRSLDYNNIAHLNNRANMIAYDILDRIKANSSHSINGPGYRVSLGNIPSQYRTTCETRDCDPAELAAYDIDQWKFIIDRQLPDGDGSIIISDNADGRTYTITIFFDDSKGQESRKQIVLRSLM